MINLKGWIWKKGRELLSWLNYGSEFGAPWPHHPTTRIFRPENITCDPSSMSVFLSHGCVFNAFGPISIGKNVWMAPNVGVISANHRTDRPELMCDPKPVTIGDHCWIGMGAIILPGVALGDYTTVGAGSVVTKSFPEGRCAIAGNPAKVIER